jgi:hypothetical protein
MGVEKRRRKRSRPELDLEALEAQGAALDAVATVPALIAEIRRLRAVIEFLAQVLGAL